ncbi:MAG TPA: sugar ABC transporter permease [Atribacteraceae bacterium]|nr:sugar ABC transporter permease [Atribacteraceae bacterium]
MMKKMSRWNKFLDRRLATTMVAPCIIILLGIFLFPLLWSLGLSFYDYSVLRPFPPRFIGFQHYNEIIRDPYIWARFATSMHFVALAVGLQLVLGVSLAFLMYDNFKGKKIFMALMLSPMMMAPVAVGAFFRFMYEPTFGIIPYLSRTLFNVNIGWLIDPSVALYSLVFVDTWMWSPFVMLFTLAGLLSIPQHLLEMGDIDRASWWQRFRNIILPQIKPLLILALLLRTMESFRLFDTIWVMTAGGPGLATETLAITLYRVAFQHYHTGRSSAIAYIMLIVVIVLTNLYLRLAMRQEGARR